MTIEVGGRAVRLCVGTPTRDGRVLSDHAECLRAMEVGCRNSGIDFCRAVCNGYDVATQRNGIVDVAMKWGATHLLMLDDDVALPEPNAVGEMLGAMAGEDADVVAALCLSKPTRCDHEGRADRKPPFASVFELPENGRRFTIEAPGRAVVRAPEGMRLLAGAGAMLIDCRTFARFHAPEDPPFRFTDDLSEDWYFSREVQRRGGRVVLDARVETVHYGTVGWTWRPGAQ